MFGSDCCPALSYKALRFYYSFQFSNGIILRNKHEILSLKWKAIFQKALKQTQQGPGNQLKVQF